MHGEIFTGKHTIHGPDVQPTQDRSPLVAAYVVAGSHASPQSYARAVQDSPVPTSCRKPPSSPWAPPRSSPWALSSLCISSNNLSERPCTKASSATWSSSASRRSASLTSTCSVCSRRSTGRPKTSSPS